MKDVANGTDHAKKSFSYSAARLWNSLSSELRLQTSLHDFRIKLRHHSLKKTVQCTRHPSKVAFTTKAYNFILNSVS